MRYVWMNAHDGTGAVAWVLSGAPEATDELRMRSSKQRSVTIGVVKAKWIQYEVRAQGGGGGASRRLQVVREQLQELWSGGEMKAMAVVPPLLRKHGSSAMVVQSCV